MPRFGTRRYEADQFYKLAMDAYRKRDLEAAIENMGRAIEILPTHGEYWAARGLLHFENGAIDRAEINFDSALQHNPYEMLGHYGKGMIAYQQQEWDEAAAHFQRAWAIDPERPEIHYYLGLICHHKNAHSTAIRWMAQAQQGFAKNADQREKFAVKWLKEIGKIIKKSQQSS